MLFFIWHNITLPRSHIFISTAASTFGACVGLFFLAVFHRFTIACLGLRGSRSTANDAWATQDLNKLTKYSGKQPLPIRYPAFSWRLDLTMGILEGFSSFLGYALMLAVNILFTIFTWHKNMLLIVITCVFRSCL